MDAGASGEFGQLRLELGDAGLILEGLLFVVIALGFGHVDALAEGLQPILELAHVQPGVHFERALIVLQADQPRMELFILAPDPIQLVLQVVQVAVEPSDLAVQEADFTFQLGHYHLVLGFR